MTYMLLLNCTLKLVEEIILYYDARSKKHQNINTLMYKVWHVEKYKITFKLIIHWTNEIL